MIVGTANFDFWGAPSISNAPGIYFLPGEIPQNVTQPGPLPGNFLILNASPYFFHIPFIAIQRILERKYRERKVSMDTSFACKRAEKKKKVGSNYPYYMMSQTTAIGIPCQRLSGLSGKDGQARDGFWKGQAKDSNFQALSKYFKFI